MCECVVVGNEHDDCNFGINNGDLLCRHMCFCVSRGACECLCVCAHACAQVCLNMIAGWQRRVGCR